MNPLLKEIRRNPALAVDLRARSVGRSARQAGSAHAAFLVLPVLAIVPLVELLSHTATLKQESGTRLDLDQVDEASYGRRHDPC
jgi:hypothetical protein